MSYYHKPRPNPLDDRRFFDFLDENASKSLGKEFMVFFNEEGKRSALNFEQFRNQTRFLAAALLQQGYRRGDRIVICAPNCFEFAISWLAVNRIGACAVLTSPGDLTAGREKLLKQLKCEGIVCGMGVDSDEERSRVLEVLNILTELKSSDGASALKSVVLIGGDDKAKSAIKHEKVFDYEKLVETGSLMDQAILDESQRRVNSEDAVLALLSSGTTNDPKAVAYSHHALVNAINLDVPGGFEEDSVTFSGWPLSWGSEAPCFAAAVVIGFTFITAPFSKITPDDSYHFMLKIIESEKCDDCCIPQQDVAKMISENFQEKYDLSSVEGFGYGGQIVPRKIIRSLLSVFPSKYAILVYSSVEVLTVGIQPLSKKSIDADDYGQMYILPDIEVKVVSQDGLVVPLGTKGEICVRGPKTFLEYLGNPAATSKAKTKTGWVYTKDYGVMYEGGKIRVLGRESDIISRGDEKFFPVEFEDILMEHQEINDLVVVGVPDKILKQELCACVIEVPGSNLQSKIPDLQKWSEERFSHSGAKLGPKYFVFMDHFPLVENSKIDRRTVQRLAAEKLGLQN